MRIILSAQEIIEFTLLITLLALQAQSVAFELPVPQLLVLFTTFLPCLCNLAIAYLFAFPTISQKSADFTKTSPAQSSSDNHAKAEAVKRSTSAARTWRDGKLRASSLEASFSDASSEALSFLFSSSSRADSSSCGSLPPAQTLPEAEQGTSSDSKAGGLQFLGEGAYGKVYVDGEDVVKVMACDNAAQLMMAQWEFECMQSVGEWCSNVVMAKELAVKAGPEGTVALLRMERCAGSLVDFLERVPAGSSVEACEAFALKVLIQAAQAVAAIHSMGLVHADIKPANILLKEFPASLESPLPPGAVKLCDFGLAYLEKDSKELVGAHGTPIYMAPEMEALGREGEEASVAPTAKVDVFSLGQTFLDAILMPEPCMDGSSDVSPATAALVKAMTAQDPIERISMDEVLELICSHPLLAC